MWLLPLLLTISSVHSLPESPCNRLKIGDKFYDKEVLWANLRRPCNLIVHKPTNRLFFSYTYPDSYSDIDSQLAFYNLNTKEYRSIAGILGGCAIAIDNANDDIYMGGSDGIYKYNMLTGIADYYRERGRNIWALFHKKNLFYISYPEQRLYMSFDGRFAIVKEFEQFEIDHFYVTEKGDIYFANKTGLYVYNNADKYVEVINELITVRQIVEDLQENLYIVTNFGIYLYGRLEGLTKLVDMKSVFSLTFDKENLFIISDETCIVKLNPSSQGCDNNTIDHW